MVLAKRGKNGSASGTAALAILKILIQVLKRKKLMSDEEILILLNSAKVEVDTTDLGGSTDEAKYLIESLMNDTDGDTTTGYNSRSQT